MTLQNQQFYDRNINIKKKIARALARIYVTDP